MWEVEAAVLSLVDDTWYACHSRCRRLNAAQVGRGNKKKNKARRLRRICRVLLEGQPQTNPPCGRPAAVAQNPKPREAWTKENAFRLPTLSNCSSRNPFPRARGRPGRTRGAVHLPGRTRRVPCDVLGGVGGVRAWESVLAAASHGLLSSWGCREKTTKPSIWPKFQGTKIAVARERVDFVN